MMKTDSPTIEQCQILLVPHRVFPGAGRSKEGWGVVVEGARIAPVGQLDKLRSSGRRIELPNQTLLPGLIDLHAYLSVDADRPNPMDRIYATDFAARAWTAARNLRRDLRSGTCVFWTDLIEALAAMVGTQRLMLGSDFPVRHGR
jgi:imidazolonepropionase-like amidohydrolase